MIEALGFVRSDAQALIGTPVTISYRDLSGNPQKTQAIIQYANPFGFAAVPKTPAPTLDVLFILP